MFCHITKGEGWMRVTNIDPNTTKSCPSAWKYLSQPRSLCSMPVSQHGGCVSAYFSPPNGVSYSAVLGHAVGAQVSSHEPTFLLLRNASLFNCDLQQSRMLYLKVTLGLDRIGISLVFKQSLLGIATLPRQVTWRLHDQ